MFVDSHDRNVDSNQTAGQQVDPEVRQKEINEMRGERSYLKRIHDRSSTNHQKQCDQLTGSMQEELKRLANAPSKTNRRPDIAIARRAALRYIDATMEFAPPDETSGLNNLVSSIRIPQPPLLQASDSHTTEDLQSWMQDSNNLSWSLEDVARQLHRYHIGHTAATATKDENTNLKDSMQQYKDDIEHHSGKNKELEE